MPQKPLSDADCRCVIVEWVWVETKLMREVRWAKVLHVELGNYRVGVFCETKWEWVGVGVGEDGTGKGK